MAEFDLPKRVPYWYAICVAASVLVLICNGGLATTDPFHVWYNVLAA